MQFKHILLAGLLALGISATPTTEKPDNCKGGQVYKSSHKRCECPPDKYWDNNKCRYPAMDPPRCPWPQKGWCSKSRDEYCEYDRNNEWCERDGRNDVWCCHPNDRDKCRGEHYPPQLPQCKDKQIYNPKSGKCECPKPLKFDEYKQKCVYPPMPKPNCPWGEKPYCGKGKQNYCEYDEGNEYCHDDGRGEVWCSKPIDVKKLLDSIFDIL